MQTGLRLDLGCGEYCEEGYVPVDRKVGKEVYPLDYPDAAADEIKASHVLEHFGNREVDQVLREWVRVLRPGGRIRLAVPDCEYVARKLLAKNPDGEPLGSYLLGGQTDENDFHKSIFNEERLRDMMERAGLERIGRWVTELEDCARLPVSLNLEGYKSVLRLDRPLPKIVAVMSMPRLAFSDNMFCALQVATELGLSFTRHTGAYWGQCLERALEGVFAEDCSYVLTVDYDTCFTAKDVRRLAALMEDNPHVDALCAVQVKREEQACLMGLLKEDGTRWPVGEGVPMSHFSGELARLYWGHFGLTLLRVSKLRALPHPWFHSVPDPEGKWGEGRLDDDLFFWKKWIDHGNSLYMANRVPVGHAQLMVSWPGADGAPVHQHATAFAKGERPEGVWQ
jgi:predicted SAM-dependent methyltransferase